MSKEQFRMNGIITRYPGENAGYGFIKPTGEYEGAPPIFFHWTAIREGCKLKEGDAVSFKLASPPKTSKNKADVAIDVTTVNTN